MKYGHATEVGCATLFAAAVAGSPFDVRATRAPEGAEAELQAKADQLAVKKAEFAAKKEAFAIARQERQLKREELEMELVPAAAGLFLGMALVLRRERPGSAPGARSRPESLDPRGT